MCVCVCVCVCVVSVCVCVCVVCVVCVYEKHRQNVRLEVPANAYRHMHVLRTDCCYSEWYGNWSEELKDVY